MAKFTKFDPHTHMKGLSAAAQQILREYQPEEERNFEECMQFFREKAEQLKRLNTDRRLQ